jgi:NAD(P)-dependent dehydrogenase (short-subunit alcohol dehydrogenase family)
MGALACALARDARREPHRDVPHRPWIPARPRRPRGLALVGSTAGISGEAGHADYAAAKSAILGGLLLWLKNEVVRRNPRTRVNAVAPRLTSPLISGHVTGQVVTVAGGMEGRVVDI